MYPEAKKAVVYLFILVGHVTAFSRQTIRLPIGDEPTDARRTAARDRSDWLPRQAEGCNIFTYFNYKDGVPPMVALNLETWRRHAAHLCHEPILINDSNVFEYIPDMPREWFRIPELPRSDLIRYALLYHHGGIYMDADFLVVKDLDRIVSEVHDFDLISYESGLQSCDKLGKFSSNFMGGKQGSAFHKAVWDLQKRRITKHCPMSKLKAKMICCFDDERRSCNVPFTYIGEGISHQMFLSVRHKSTPPIKWYCFGAKYHGFAPWGLEDILRRYPKLEDARAYWSGGDPRLDFIVDRNTYLNRTMYHLFSSNSRIANNTRDQLLDPSTFLGALYRKSFDVPGA